MAIAFNVVVAVILIGVPEYRVLELVGFAGDAPIV